MVALAQSIRQSTAELKKQIEQAVAGRPHSLVLDERKDKFVLSGTFCLWDDETVFDSYEVRIDIPFDFPRSEPRVYETASRIPQTCDRHNSTNACICVWENWLIEVDDVSFSSYLDGPIFRYFLSQTIFEGRNKKAPDSGDNWVFGEEDHGRPGRLAAYARSLGIDACPETVIRYLKLLSRDGLKARWPCPCGSQIEIRLCHGNQIFQLREKIPRWLAQTMLEKLTS